MTINEISEAYGVGTDGTLDQSAKGAVRHGITTLAIAVSNCAHAHGWWSDDDGNRKDRNMGEMIALMHSELSEALESYRDSEPHLWYKHTLAPGFSTTAKNDESSEPMHQGVPGKAEGIAAEFADCIIRILDTCRTMNIPVAQALIDKHEYNMTRPYRHGGKAC